MENQKKEILCEICNKLIKKSSMNAHKKSDEHFLSEMKQTIINSTENFNNMIKKI